MKPGREIGFFGLGGVNHGGDGEDKDGAGAGVKFVV